MKKQASISFTKESPWLAPLAGWSDLPFRLLCRGYGAEVCYTEMISAKGVIYNNKGTQALLETTEKDSPLIVQLCGSEALYMGEAIQILIEKGFSLFDCNMGCSVPKVTRTGSGASMLKHIDNALAIAEVMINKAEKNSVGFKLRLGWDSTTEVFTILAKNLKQLGAGWITLHPRTAKQGFTGTANWKKLTFLKESLHIPIIASGDLFTATDALRCIQETKVNTVMYARGALRDPSIFQQHKRLIKGKPASSPNAQKLLMQILLHACLARKYTSSHQALLKMRTIIPRYTRNFNGVKQLRLDIIRCTSWEHFAEALQRFFTNHIPTPSEDLRSLIYGSIQIRLP